MIITFVFHQHSYTDHF